MTSRILRKMKIRALEIRTGKTDVFWRLPKRFRIWSGLPTPRASRSISMARGRNSSAPLPGNSTTRAGVSHCTRTTAPGHWPNGMNRCERASHLKRNIGCGARRTGHIAGFSVGRRRSQIKPGATFTGSAPVRILNRKNNWRDNARNCWLPSGRRAGNCFGRE